ncbi:hypothetical protein GCM10009122_56750 [Fulvivirga kasyanovii]
MKKVLTTLITITVMNLPISCVMYDCGSSGPVESRVKELTATIGSYGTDNFNTTMSTSFDQTAVRMQVTENEYLKAYAPMPSGLSFINSAYACDPVILGPSQRITRLEITSTEPVFSNNTEYKPGTSLNALFHIANRNEIDIEAFLVEQNEARAIFGELGDEVIFMLKNAPDASINLKLQVEIEFNVGESFQLETDFLKIEV